MFTAMLMDYPDKRTIEIARHLTNAPRQIKIFKVHEETLIECIDALENVAAQEHEAARQALWVQLAVVVMIAHFQIRATFSAPGFRD